MKTNSGQKLFSSMAGKTERFWQANKFKPFMVENQIDFDEEEKNICLIFFFFFLFVLFFSHNAKVRKPSTAIYTWIFSHIHIVPLTHTFMQFTLHTHTHTVQVYVFWGDTPLYQAMNIIAWNEVLLRPKLFGVTFFLSLPPLHLFPAVFCSYSFPKIPTLQNLEKQ